MVQRADGGHDRWGEIWVALGVHRVLPEEQWYLQFSDHPNKMMCLVFLIVICYRSNKK
jgi:hypothetical protein